MTSATMEKAAPGKAQDAASTLPAHWKRDDDSAITVGGVQIGTHERYVRDDGAVVVNGWRSHSDPSDPGTKVRLYMAFPPKSESYLAIERTNTRMSVPRAVGYCRGCNARPGPRMSTCRKVAKEIEPKLSMEPRNDFQPLPGKLPSQALLDLVESQRGYGVQTMLVEQTAAQISEALAAYAQRAQSPYRLLTLGLRLDTTTQPDFPYGPDFTDHGFCRFREWANEAFAAAKSFSGKVLGDLSGALPDEGQAFSDHCHRCRPCRDRLKGLIQDLEGEVGAVARYGPHNRRDELS